MRVYRTKLRETTQSRDDETGIQDNMSSGSRRSHKLDLPCSLIFRKCKLCCFLPTQGWEAPSVTDLGSMHSFIDFMAVMKDCVLWKGEEVSNAIFIEMIPRYQSITYMMLFPAGGIRWFYIDIYRSMDNDLWLEYLFQFAELFNLGWFVCKI